MTAFFGNQRLPSRRVYLVPYRLVRDLATWRSRLSWIVATHALAGQAALTEHRAVAAALFTLIGGTLIPAVTDPR